MSHSILITFWLEVCSFEWFLFKLFSAPTLVIQELFGQWVADHMFEVFIPMRSWRSSLSCIILTVLKLEKLIWKSRFWCVSSISTFQHFRSFLSISLELTKTLPSSRCSILVDKYPTKQNCNYAVHLSFTRLMATGNPSGFHSALTG